LLGEITLPPINLLKPLKIAHHYNSIAPYPASCDAPVDVIAKKQVLSAMEHRNQNFADTRGSL
jgi:hypothetical protein